MMNKQIVSIAFGSLVLSLSAAQGSSLGGFAGRKAAAHLDGRVFSRYAMEDAMDEAVRAFETHEDDLRFGKGWQGEYWGRTMLGHTGAVRTFGRTDHREYIIRQSDRLIDGFMRPDGYLGTYKNPKSVVDTSGGVSTRFGVLSRLTRLRGRQGFSMRRRRRWISSFQCSAR